MLDINYGNTHALCMQRKMTYLEAPSINTSIETIMAAVIEVLGANYTSQQVTVQDLPAATMWHPANDMMVIWVGHDGMKFHGECHTTFGLFIRVIVIWKYLG